MLATVGLLPDEILPKHLLAADTLPETFTKKLAAWVKTEEQGEFVYVPPPKDLEKLYRQLKREFTTTEVAAWFEVLGIEDHELITGFFEGITRAREYVAGVFPAFHIETPAGPQLLPPSHDEAEEVASIFNVLDEPTRILDEFSARTLTPDQALAFRECYPDLYAHANQAIDLALTERRAKDPSFLLGWEAEAVLNVFRGAPPENIPAPPPPPQQPPAKLDLDPDRDRTQAEVSSAPKSRK